MARVLLIGAGPLPQHDPGRLGFPELRTAQLLKAMLRAGHSVQVVLLGEEDRGPETEAIEGSSASCVVEGVEINAPGWLARVQAAREAWRPDVVVSAGPYEPARAAALTIGDEPLWLDVPGDPFAEAQAKRARGEDAEATASMRLAYAAGYARADAFGVISHAQRFALLGQLGLLGRLSPTPDRSPEVQVVPAAMDFGGVPRGEPRRWAAEGALTLAVSGGFNTWFDGETLLAGVLLAMEELPELRLITTGGPIPGHHEATWDTFAAGALASPYADRFELCGWIPHSELAKRLGGAQVGVCLDRPGLEPELGTRTRLLLYAWLGMPILATARCELARELAGVRLLHTVEPGSPESLAAGIEHLWREGEEGAASSRLQGYLGARATVEQTAAPLLRWLRAPRRAEPCEDPGVVMAQRLARAEDELAAVVRSPTWRLLSSADRLARGIPRQLWGRFKR